MGETLTSARPTLDHGDRQRTPHAVAYDERSPVFPESRWILHSLATVQRRPYGTLPTRSSTSAARKYPNAASAGLVRFATFPFRLAGGIENGDPSPSVTLFSDR